MYDIVSPNLIFFLHFFLRSTGLPPSRPWTWTSTRSSTSARCWPRPSWRASRWRGPSRRTSRGARSASSAWRPGSPSSPGASGASCASSRSAQSAAQRFEIWKKNYIFFPNSKWGNAICQHSQCLQFRLAELRLPLLATPVWNFQHTHLPLQYCLENAY